MSDFDNTTIKSFEDIGRGCIKFNADPNSPSCKSANSYKLDVYNWLEDLPETQTATDIVEIRFKNTRKGFYKNINGLKLKKGDIVAVEASPGHDIGIVSLVGELVLEQMRKYGANTNEELKKIYRKAKPADIQKWEQAISREHLVMLETRQVANRLRLEMKIGDIDFQGDGTKAIFYYISDERVDFRELIKILADKFKIRIEMRQIGARQEAGRIGGIGSCGRELCCSTWMTNFVSVSTSAARFQELSLNPQKLAGQCGKLKCCLNYELEVYVDAQKDFPSKQVPLQIKDGTAYYQKTDVFKRVMWYSYSPDSAVNITPVPIDRVKNIMIMNKEGFKPESLLEEDKEGKKKVADPDYTNVVGQDSISRFADQKKPKLKKNKKNRKPIQLKKKSDDSVNTTNDDSANSEQLPE
jgi:cell fate regulator YaaT (PSP1 superfamily)